MQYDFVSACKVTKFFSITTNKLSIFCSPHLIFATGLQGSKATLCDIVPPCQNNLISR